MVYNVCIHYSLPAWAIFAVGFGIDSAAARRINSPGSCTIADSTISTVAIGNINKAPPISSFLSFTCTDVTPLKPGHRMVYCWHIHGGAYTSRFTYREAKLGKSIINFNFYTKDWDGGTKKVGSAREPYNILGYATRISTNGKTDTYIVQTPFTLRFEGNNSASLPEGNYTYTAGGTHFVLSNIAESDEMNYGNACNIPGGDITGTPQFNKPVQLNISVKTYCNISVSRDLIFSKQMTLQKPVKDYATVNVDCSAGTDYRVKIDKGNNYFDNMRHMTQGGGDKQAIAYTISPENWKGVGLGTPHGQDYTIDGTVPAQPTPDAGMYRDRLVVTIKFIR